MSLQSNKRRLFYRLCMVGTGGIDVAEIRPRFTSTDWAKKLIPVIPVIPVTRANVAIII